MTRDTPNFSLLLCGGLEIHTRGNYGPARSLRINPLHTYLEKGIKWGGGSDYPVTPFAPRYGLWASVERKPLNAVYGAHPFGTSESVDIHVALKSYTIWAAHQLFLETGSAPSNQAKMQIWLSGTAIFIQFRPIRLET